jgi:hypothetical protein
MLTLEAHRRCGRLWASSHPFKTNAQRSEAAISTTSSRWNASCLSVFGIHELSHKCKAQEQKRGRKMKITVVFAAAALACAPLALAERNAAYPKENVAAFILEKLDATSLPSAMRPKNEKGKKTLADYGYTVQMVEQNKAIVGASDGAKQLSFEVLDQGPSGIYVCVAEPDQSGREAKTQSVMLLKRKGSNALLKGRESFREFASCPVIGANDNDSTASSYGGD